MTHAAVIRSTWDSVDRPREYLRWARDVSRATVLANPFAAIAWNLDKTYLPTLQDRNVLVVPTIWVTSETQWTTPAYEFVIKPSVSGGGRETARYSVNARACPNAHGNRPCRSRR